MSIFVLEPLRGSDERTCGKCLTEGSWHRLPKCQPDNRWDQCYYFLCFTGDGSEAQKGKRPAKVPRLYSDCPRLGSPKVDPEVGVCSILAVAKGDWVGMGRDLGRKDKEAESGATSGRVLQRMGSL